jgi:rhamnogalacturonan endolyase
MEYLTRGVHAVNAGNGEVFISWRLLGTEDSNLAFNLYRSSRSKSITLDKQPTIVVQPLMKYSKI